MPKVKRLSVHDCISEKYQTPKERMRLRIANALGAVRALGNSYLSSQLAFSVMLVSGSARAECTLPECAPPEGWDNFANNLGSDLAPLLALFGEKVTTQYMSESLGWIDSLLFALAPLGIITAMISAIRVAGRPILRSLIGRAKESRGDVEAEIMSSTSSDVCELWNGEGVVRVLGSPVLIQLVYVESEENDPMGLDAGSDAGIYTFHEATKLCLYTQEGSGNRSSDRSLQTDMEMYSDVEHFRARQNPPNLSLNVSIKPVSRYILIAFVVLGFLLQGGVLVFAALTQYILKLSKNDAPPVSYGFPIFFVGTLSLAVGMFLCAHVVETSTHEVTWVASKRPRTVIWLQQGGQIVGDQKFESFARVTRWSMDRPADNRIITSSKAKHLQTGRSLLVTIAISTSLVGFIVQFVGLRVVHSSVIVVQLGAILIMTALRSCAHIQRNPKNDIKDPDQVEGHELDWLAKDLDGCEAWEIVTGPKAEMSTSNISPNTAAKVTKTRARLATLSSNWKLEDRDKVIILQSAIETAINQVSSTMTLKDELKGASEFKWAVPVKAKFKGDEAPHFSEVFLVLTRKTDENGNWTAWETDRSQLEAVLCLWISSLTEVNRMRAKNGSPRLKNVRLLGQATEEAKVDYKLWIHRGTTPTEGELDPTTTRYFGQIAGDGTIISPSTSYLCTDAKGELELLCAQELYAAFIFQLADKIDEVGGATARRVNDAAADKQDNDWGQFRLNNSNLASLATDYHECGLGTVEEAYFVIVPAFRAVGKLPSPHEAYREAKKASRRLDKEGFWEKATEIDSWLYSNSKKTHATRHDIVVIDVDIRKRLLALTQKIITGITKGESDDKLQKMWNTAYSRCQMFTEASEDRAQSLVNLSLTCDKLKLETNLDTVLRLAFDATREMDMKKKHTVAGLQRIADIVSSLTRFALGNGYLDEAEVLAKSLWADTITQWHESTKETNHLISKLLIDIRQERGHFLLEDGFKNYLSSPGLLRLAAETNVDSGVSTTDITDSRVPIDLLLIRKYRTLLQIAAEYGHKSMVQQLLNENLKVGLNAQPAEYLGRTALQAAAGAGDIEIVEMLLAANADINAAPAIDSGRTALQAAAGAGHTEIVELLLAAGANVNAEPANTSGRTALQAAAEAGKIGIVELLLAAGANLHAKPADTSGRTALQAAAGGGHIGVVKIFLAAGAKIDSPPGNKSGRTSLQAAAESGHIAVVDQLLVAGADINAKVIERDFGRTALQAAAGAGHNDIVKRLLAANADINAEAARNSGRTALQAAAEAGHTEIVEILLAANADVNAEPAYISGRTTLHAAAGPGHRAVVELLLAANVDVNAQTPHSTAGTALQAAANGGHEEIVELLLIAGANVNDELARGANRTALQAAAEAGHTGIVELLLAAKADINAPPAKDSGRTALQAAAGVGHIEIVKLLLAAGADVNAAPASLGRTALQAAAEIGHIEIVKLLLEANANVNAEAAPISGRTTLQAAASGGHEDIVKLLLMANANTNTELGSNTQFTPLQAAAKYGHAGIVGQLLAANATVNAEAWKYSGRTALQAAAEGGHIEIAKTLLAAGANVNGRAAESSGRTALQAAAEHGHAELVKIFLAANANVNAIESSGGSGRTAIQAAAGGGCEEVVKLLLAAGADINAEAATRSGRTALQAAAESGHTEVVRILLAANADANAKPGSNSGITALQAAAGAGHTEIVKLLLAANADIKTHSPRETPLRAAVAAGHLEVIEVLLAAGVDVNTTTTHGTALQTATSIGNIGMVKILLEAGANPSAPPEQNSKAALVGAIQSGHTAVCKMLLEANVDVNANWGMTAITSAVVFDRLEIMELLLAANAKHDLNTIALAEQHGRSEIIKLLKRSIDNKAAT